MQEKNESGVAVDSTKTLEKFTPNGSFLFDIQLSGMGDSATFELQQADTGETNWETAKTYSGVTSIDDVLEGVAGRIRVEITSAASNGTTADYYMGVDDNA